MVFKQFAKENGFFTKYFTLYIEKEQIAGLKNGHATRESLDLDFVPYIAEN
jgi:hypothetical protein